jgi:hypothetical protein
MVAASEQLEELEEVRVRLGLKDDELPPRRD